MEYTTHGKLSIGYVLTLLIASGVFLGSSLAVHAQGSAGIRIAPSIIEEAVDPGETLNLSLRVTNVSAVPITYYFAKKDIKGVTGNGTPIFAEDEEPTDFEVSSWIRFETESIDLDAGEEKEVSFQVIVPADATPGSHFGGIFMVLKPPKLRESGAGVGYEVGTILSLRIAGDTLEEARIREFFSDKTMYSKPEVKFTTTVENIGNVLIRPVGPIEIINIFGEKVDSIRVNSSAGAVLPGVQRTFENNWKGERFTFGRYQVVLSLVYGDDGRKTISQTISFWVLPLRIILPILGVLLTIIVVIYAGVKLHIRRRLKEMYQHSADMQGHDRAAVQDYMPGADKNAPLSKLTVITVATLSFSIIFLLILFVLFA